MHPKFELATQEAEEFCKKFQDEDRLHVIVIIADESDGENWQAMRGSFATAEKQMEILTEVLSDCVEECEEEDGVKVIPKGRIRNDNRRLRSLVRNPNLRHHLYRRPSRFGVNMSLQTLWDNLLAAEGLPSEIRSLYKGRNGEGRGEEIWSLNQLAPGGNENPLCGEEVASEVIEYWAAFEKAMWSLTLTEVQRDCMIDYCEHGYVDRAARNLDMPERAVQKLVDRIHKLAIGKR